MLIFGALPVPKIRSMLLHLQLQLAATLGDCYVLLVRRIEQSSIVSKIRQDLRWMATRCSEVAIVAHSQGGAVAHLALRSEIPAELRLIFTFGSGLKKLEEAAQLIKRGSSFTLSSALTSIALVVLLLCCGLLTMVAVAGIPASAASILLVLPIGIGAGGICFFGIKDHLKGIRLPELDRWIQHLTTMPLNWVDCYASADPVPNGALKSVDCYASGDAVPNGATGPAAKYRSREVCNRSSMLGDHTTYWANRDEFVSLLYEEIARSRTYDSVPKLRLQELKHVAESRRWRVAIGRFIWWAGVAGVVAVIARRWLGWQGLASWAWRRGSAWLSTVFGLQVTVASSLSVDWVGIGLLAAVLLACSAASGVWASWNESEMSGALGLPVPKNFLMFPRVVWVLTGVWFFLWLIAGVIVGGPPSFWVFMLCLLTAVGLFALKPRPSPSRGQGPTDMPPSADGSESEPTSRVYRLVSVLTGLAVGLMIPFSLFASAWESFVWVTAHLSHGSLAGFRPDSISSYAVGAVAVIVEIVWLTARVIWTAVRPTI
jgi:hypothetical protein